MNELMDKNLLATWLSLAIKILPVLVILPFLLINYEISISNFWLILVSFASFGLVFEFGLTSTFERFISYIRSGKSISENTKEIDLNDLILTSKKIFLILSSILFFGLLCIGSLFLYKPINLAVQENANIFFLN